MANEQRFVVDRPLLCLLEVLSSRWSVVRDRWKDDLTACYPDLTPSLPSLGRVNVDPYAGSLMDGRLDPYLEGVGEEGCSLARGGVPFHVVMHSLHLFEERCGDVLRPNLPARPELWQGFSSFDRLMHAGIAALAEGYYRELAESHERELLFQVRDTVATLNHRINNPLAAVSGHTEMLLHRSDLDPAVRDRLTRIQQGAHRIRDAVSDLLSLEAFTKTPYLAPVELIEPRRNDE